MQIQKFDQTKISCSNTEKVVIADILQKTDKLLKVAVVNTNIVLVLHKNNEKKIYIGNHKNLEFTSTGEKI